MSRPRIVLAFFLLTLFLIGASALGMMVGATNSFDPVILWEVRFPRVILGILVGTALAAAGTLFQGLLRNPLADPYILGTSGGAAVGSMASYFVRFLFPALGGNLFLHYCFIFAGAFGATMTAYSIARTEKQVPVVNLLLSGVVVSTFCGALILLFASLHSRDSFPTFLFMMGSLIDNDWRLMSISAPIIIAGIFLSFFLARDLDILSLGEEKARSLGIEPEILKTSIFALASLIVAAAVAVSGPIGFVGLIVPHMVRIVIGPNHKILIPASSLAGGAFLVLADALARTIARPIEIPVGVITAMIGAPFFLYLLKRKRKEKFF